MKFVECVERLPELICSVKPFRLDIFVGNGLAVPFPDAKDPQLCKSALRAKGTLRPMSL